VDANKQPVAPDAAPTFRIYGPSGLLASAGGTCVDGHNGSVTGATNASPLLSPRRITAAAPASA
jgi:hypothetical protein